MKNIRLIIAIILFPITYPLLVIVCSVFGISIALSMVLLITVPFIWFKTDTKENKIKETKDAMFGFAPIIFPFLIWGKFVKTGSFPKLN